MIAAVLISSSVATFLYFLFYLSSPVIWSFNITLPINEFTPWLRGAVVEHDGVEVYVLYFLAFFAVGGSFLINELYLRFDRPFLRKVLIFAMSICAVFYFRTVGFFPPIADPNTTWQGGIFFLLVTVLAGTLSLVLYKNRYAIAFLLTLIFLVCLVPSQWDWFSYDSSYYFTSALRIIHGFPLKETYFQYDYFIAFLIAGWIKLGFSPKFFHLLGLFSYFFLFVGVFFFSRRLFLDKRFPVLLLISLPIVRIYGNWGDPSQLMQVTPLRLDLWFPLLALVYWRGAEDLAVGIFLGALVIMAHSFGLIYAVSYLAFVGALLLFDLVERNGDFRDILKRYFFRYWPNFLSLLGGVLIYSFFLKNTSEVDPAILYQKYGLGFMPIARQSFYWYILVFLSSLFIILWKSRRALSDRYFKTGVFLVFLFIGNSLYFFGRSHENNILNISTPLLLAGFISLDVLQARFQEFRPGKRYWKSLMPLVAILLIAGFTYLYSGKAIARIQAQGHTLTQNPFIKKYAFDVNVPAIKAITQGSSKVLFLTATDFPYYFEGGYIPQSYHSFTCSWILMKDYAEYLNQKIAEGYFLVLPLEEGARETLPVMERLQARKKVSFQNLVVITNNILPLESR